MKLRTNRLVLLIAMVLAPAAATVNKWMRHLGGVFVSDPSDDEFLASLSTDGAYSQYGSMHDFRGWDPYASNMGAATWGYAGGYQNISNAKWTFKALVAGVDYWSPSGMPRRWKTLPDFLVPFGSARNLTIASEAGSTPPYQLPPRPLSVVMTKKSSVENAAGNVSDPWIDGSCTIPGIGWPNGSERMVAMGAHVWLANLGSPEVRECSPNCNAAKDVVMSVRRSTAVSVTVFMYPLKSRIGCCIGARA